MVKKSTSRMLLFLASLLFWERTRQFACAEINETPSPIQSSSSSNNNIEQLIQDAQTFFSEGNPIDARAKLQLALQIAPQDYRPHMLLGTYYLAEVGHFTLAYRYIKHAEELFQQHYGSDEVIAKSPALWHQHARLLYLLSEAELNLDRYSDSLKTLDRFSKRYWDDWYPGTRAWVLMKLKHIDEAIVVAQSGLLNGAEPGRTYNILGILLSMKGSRELSLEAFARAIVAESSQGSLGQAATPLNNAGEVYHELFRDDFAEAAWIKAIQLPDGCEHILPSLNLALLYIDQLRLFEAERVLNDFEACYQSHGSRSDTEHRALLALARGRIALRKGFVPDAMHLLSQAQEREQWFGKIGTNANDVQLAATISLAQSLAARIAQLRFHSSSSLAEHFQNWSEIQWLRARILWLYHQARSQAVGQMDDFEDLSLRNTDAMLEYPTLGDFAKTFSHSAIEARLHHLETQDTREIGHPQYTLYEAQVAEQLGDFRSAAALAMQSMKGLRESDRLSRAQALGVSITAENNNIPFWRGESQSEQKNRWTRTQELFLLSPPFVSYFGLPLPVAVTVSDSTSGLLQSLAESIKGIEPLRDTSEFEPRIGVTLSASPAKKEGWQTVEIRIVDRLSNRTLITAKKSIDSSESSRVAAANYFHDSIFRHYSDPAAGPLPTLDLLSGLTQ